MIDLEKYPKYFQVLHSLTQENTDKELIETYMIHEARTDDGWHLTYKTRAYRIAMILCHYEDLSADIIEYYKLDDVLKMVLIDPKEFRKWLDYKYSDKDLLVKRILMFCLQSSKPIYRG